MTTQELVALVPTISPLIVLLVYMFQQSRRDSKDVSVAWVGIAPELFEGFREDLKASRQDAAQARDEAREAREDAREARAEADRYRTRFNELSKEFHTYKRETSAEIARLRAQQEKG